MVDGATSLQRLSYMRQYYNAGTLDCFTLWYPVEATGGAVVLHCHLLDTHVWSICNSISSVFPFLLIICMWKYLHETAHNSFLNLLSFFSKSKECTLNAGEHTLCSPVLIYMYAVLVTWNCIKYAFPSACCKAVISCSGTEECLLG